jgi:hypothetical protein
MIKRTRNEWKALVEQWKASGKTMTAWCRECQIPKNTFIYWAKGSPKRVSKKSAEIARNDFTELKGGEPKAEVLIEWRGCKIHIDGEAASIILGKCLHIIGRHSC